MDLFKKISFPTPVLVRGEKKNNNNKKRITNLSTEKKKKKNEVLPRLELGSLDSKSKVLTITPQDRAHWQSMNTWYMILLLSQITFWNREW